MTDLPDITEVQKVLAAWADSDPKIRLLVFFRQNPGMIETLEGLARRLAIPLDRLREDLPAHVAIGILQAREIGGGKTVYSFDRARWKELGELVTSALERRRGEAPR